MPVVWNTETEAKLFAGLFKVCDIKVTKQQMGELAEIIGPECTAKAITHRIAKIRTAAGTLSGGKKGSESDDVTATSKYAKKGAKGAKGKKRKAAADDDGDDALAAEDDDEEVLKKAKVEEAD